MRQHADVEADFPPPPPPDVDSDFPDLPPPAVTADRLPASCHPTEEAAIGRLLRSGNGVVREFRHRLRPRHLRSERLRLILDAALLADSTGRPSDEGGVHKVLLERGELERVGGLKYLNAVENRACTAEQLPRHLEEIRRAATLRVIGQLNEKLHRLTTRDPGQDSIDSTDPRRRALLSRIKKLQRAIEGNGGRARIVLTLDLPAMVDAAIDALVGAKANLYQRAQSLVRVVRQGDRPGAGIARESGAPVIYPIGDAALLEELVRAADWIRGTGEEQKPTDPPKKVRGALFERMAWPGIPWLESIISAPAMRPDGSILELPGYDARTGLLLDVEGATFPPVPEHPTREQAREALMGLAEPFVEFPFEDPDSGLAASVAAVLTILGRSAFEGPAPLFAIRSTTPGSGKDLLARGVAIIGTGHEPARTTAPRGKEADAEWRKRVLAHALAGDRAILIGNVEGALGSATLADTLTKVSVTERVLGENRLVTAPIAAVWFATGNGISFRGDLGRRVVPIDLDPEVEHPEDREGPRPGQSWTHPELIGYIRERRASLVTAGLTILRAFHVAGRPAHGRPLKGSFEGWDRLVRAAVLWVLGVDPLAGCEAIRAEADQDLDTLRAALACWRDAFVTQDLTTAEAVQEARKLGGEILAALAGLSGCEEAKLDGRALGYALRRVRGRTAGGLRFVLGGDDRHEKVKRWRVEVCG